MANYCDFVMQIVGRKDDVEELIEMMQWKGKYEGCGLGRIYECYQDNIEELNENVVSAQVSGYCAWSVLTAMRGYDGRCPSLESETERLNLVVEVYSTEPGMGFQEHCMIENGDVVLDECVDYQEHYIGDFDTLEEYNNEYGTHFTEDMIQDEEYIYIGGYGDQYGDFKKVYIKNLK
jgi:hypothetical protein